MMKAGELFAGYGGLAIAVEHVFGAETAWVCEYDEAPAKILAHRFPHAPNHRDVTTVNWAELEPVNIISGGSPCQDISAAGARRGMTEGTRSNLWVAMREAIATQKPDLVIWENVKGAFSATATSSLEHCPGCVGETRDREPVLRALGRVLGDLSTLGYDAQWRTIRVSDIGGPHHRARVFILAHRRDTYTWRSRRGAGRARPHQENPLPADSCNVAERSTSWNTAEPAQKIAGKTLPTPKASDGKFATPRTTGRPVQKAQHLATRAVHDMPGSYLPTPTCSDAQGPRNENSYKTRLEKTGRKTTGKLSEDTLYFDFGEYTPAIRRWETVIGRQAPPAATPSKTGRPQLNPRFSEWLMGLPDGWVTDPELGLTRAQQLKAIGNGVCPQQATAALADMWQNIKPKPQETPGVI